VRNEPGDSILLNDDKAVPNGDALCELDVRALNPGHGVSRDRAHR
jgi:hypothetical protein